MKFYTLTDSLGKCGAEVQLWLGYYKHKSDKVGGRFGQF